MLFRSSVFKAAIPEAAEKVDAAERLVAIPGPTGRNPLLVMVSPLDKESRHSRHLVPTLAVLTVTDPEQRLETNQTILKRLYGLTGTEADVTARFVRGESIREIAEQTGRSYETVRWHLKQVMSKVGVKQQIDLFRIVQSAVSPLTDESAPYAPLSRAPRHTPLCRVISVSYASLPRLTPGAPETKREGCVALKEICCSIAIPPIS